MRPSILKIEHYSYVKFYDFILGVNRFMKDIEVMLGFKIWLVWKILWMVISPLVLLVGTLLVTEKFSQAREILLNFILL